MKSYTFHFLSYDFLGIQFETSAIFRRHVQESCQHEARVPIIICLICHLKSSRSQMQNTKALDSKSTRVQNEHVNAKENDIEKIFSKLDERISAKESLIDYRSVISHLYQNHVTLIYRCTACPRAFVKKEAIYDHRMKKHDGELTNTEERKKGNFISPFIRYH